MEQKVAVLLTCYNRKDKTINCLTHLFDAHEAFNNEIQISVYLTDDGSTDNTSDEVMKLFPSVKILKGTGFLFWAGGMRNSWNMALENDYDSYLLLNDDTNVLENLFEELIMCQKYALSNYKCNGIFIGATHDGENNFTYGGSIVKSKFLNTYKRLIPNGKIEKCDLGNGNIMMVTRDVVKKIGIFSEDYLHGVADYDYTLTAKRENIPVLISANYCGICKNNNTNPYSTFVKLNFAKRKKYLFHPKGLALSDQIRFMKKFYPYRVPFTYAAAWFKLFFPKSYIAISKLR
jgi:GT2 family glycosyltransferase